MGPLVDLPRRIRYEQLKRFIGIVRITFFIIDEKTCLTYFIRMKYEVSKRSKNGDTMSSKLNIQEVGAVNIPERVKEVLKNAIYDGSLKPGDKLPSEESLRNQFKVSKTVMREALSLLVAEGLIEKKRGAMGGSFVAKGNAKRILDVVLDCYHLGGLTIEEVIDFRRNLEPIVLQLACERHIDEDLDLLKANLEQCRAALDEGRVDRENQVDFHRLIAVASHNRLLLSSMSAAIKISREFTSCLEFPFDEAQEDFNFNVQFYECIKNRESERARSLMEHHFERSRLLVERYKTLNT